MITASGLYVVLLKSLSVLQIGMGVYFLIFKCAAAMLFVSLGLMGLNRSTKADQLAAQQQTEKLTTGSILARSSAGVMLALSNPYEFVWIITVIPVLLGTMTFSFVDIYVIRSVTIWADILVQSSYIIPILYFRRFFGDNTLKYVRVASSLILMGICLPAGRLHRHSRFFRLFLNRLLSAVEEDPQEPDIPALMILDEMHVLGHMSALETGAGLLAGFGVRIWSIWQDLNQLKHLYQARWETFMGNAGIMQFFGMNDLTTLEYVSKRLGTSSVMSISQGEISQQQSLSGFSGKSKSIQAAPLLSIDEVGYFFSRQSENQLIIYPGSDPIFMKRVPYWDEFYSEYRSS
ncbi:MAG: type IV secretory system conjugative DNA transfer family protein [Pseudomonadota bacterium]